jgi:hypothetical protein
MLAGADLLKSRLTDLMKKEISLALEKILIYIFDRRIRMLSIERVAILVEKKI